MIRADLIEIRSNKFIVINLFPLVVTAYMILDVGRIRVTFVAIRTLYTTYTAQMTYVVIEIFPPFEPLPASIAVQIVAIEIRIRIFHATNLVFLFARVPHVERQISLLGERLAALRTLYSVRPCTGRRVFPFWKLKTQTRYVEQTFSRASIPSRLNKVKRGGNISSPFRSLCGPPLCVYVYVHVCTISLCTIHVCVYACTCTYRESERKKILSSVDWSVDIYNLQAFVYTVTPKSRQETPRKRWIRFLSCESWRKTRFLAHAPIHAFTLKLRTRTHNSTRMRGSLLFGIKEKKKLND